MILFHKEHFKLKIFDFLTVILLISLITAFSVEAVTITRNPYLQLSTEDSVVIRWRTQENVRSIVRYWKSGGSTTTVENSSSLMIQGELKKNPSDFIAGTGNKNISSRSRTDSFLLWSPPLWTVEGATNDDDQRTINSSGNDISEIIKEIIDETGWAQGDDMAFIISGSGERVAESRNNSGSNMSPLLHIEYKVNDIQQTDINIRVSQGKDDAEEYIINQDVNRGSSDLELGTAADITKSQLVGIIFRNINLPSNAVITKAYIEFTVDEANKSLKEHEVTITGLDPDTKYFYEILDNSGVNVIGGGADHYFRTNPTKGTAKATRIWVLGDSGQGGLGSNAGDDARVVRDKFYVWNGSNNPPESEDEHANVVLMLGDNAYDFGEDTEYQFGVFENMYENTLRNSVLWPVLGNHEVKKTSVTFTDSVLQSGVYYDTFTLPRAGQAGGEVSGTEAYYSFDYGNIHFVCLESMTLSPSSFATGMRTWLENDLSNIGQGQKWIIATWHHPPYSWGSHNTDNGNELRSKEMRENVLGILEDHGVDMVLTGHSHSYERSMLIHGHYGISNTFNKSEMTIDFGNGLESENDGVYIKSGKEGIVYTVAGSASKIANATFEGPPIEFHPVMVDSMKRLGSVVLDVNANGKRIDSYFVDDLGQELDHFVLEKPDVVFSAYNDLSYGGTCGSGDPNVTYYTTNDGTGTPPCGNAGLLKDYDNNGSNTTVTLTVTGGNWNGTSMTSQGKLSIAGTDAYRVFDGKLDATGVISYNTNPVKLEFSGMSSSHLYEVVVFGNRDRTSYTNRISKITIAGANTFKNKSTYGAVYTDADDPDTIIVNGYNTQEGYVARFTDIQTNGAITITISDGGSASPPKPYVNAVMLKELNP